MQQQDLGSAVLDVSGALIVVLDKQGRIVRFNQACERTTGYSQEEVAGKCVWDLFLVPEETEEVRAVFSQLRSGMYPNVFENSWITRDGEHRLIHWSNTALLDDDGEVEYVVGTGIDFSELRRADEALQKLSIDLSERIKELECLYAISALVEKPGITLEEILQGTVDLVRMAMQYPEITCAQILLDDQAFISENYRETPWHLIREIWAAGSQAGKLQVCCLEAGQNGGKDPFLHEEISLISAIAQRLGEIIERMQSQEALRYSEERYALSQRAANIGSWDWDIQTGDLRWTAQVESLFGFGRGEFSATYEAFLDSVHPEDRDYVVSSIEACVQQDVDYAIEHRIVWPDGTSRWVSETGDIIRDEKEQAIRMFGVVQDITDSKQADEQIQQQNAFLTSILESLTHPFYVVRVADYAVEMANTAAYAGSLSELPKCFTLLHGQSKPCAETGQICPIEIVRQTKKPAIVEHAHHDVDGNKIITEVRCYPLFDDKGTVVRIIEYCLDITGRKQAETALQESEARWRSVTRDSPDHVIILDKDLNIQFVNHASPGLTVEELIGTPLWAYASVGRRSEIKDLLGRVLKTGEPRSYNTQYSAPDGSTVYYESRVVARTMNGQIIGLTVNARDITDHERTEHALREAKELADQARREEQTRRREADRRRRIAESLADVLVALNSDQPLGQIIDFIAAQARQALEVQAVVICKQDGETGTVDVQAAHGLPGGFVAGLGEPPGVAALKQATATRRVVTVPDLTAANLDVRPDAEPIVSDKPSDGRFRALLAVPVLIQDSVYGGILLYYAHPRPFPDEEIALAAIYGEQVALAVENAQLREQVRQAAVAAERSRLARDLHDSVTQALFSASLVAEVLPQVWERSPQEAWEGIEELRQLTRGALAEMRTLLLELRPSTLGETRLEDLLAQLTEAVTVRSQISIVLNSEPSPVLPLTVHVTFYRVAQEALHNVVKHARASQVSVSLKASPPIVPGCESSWQGNVLLCVSDDGQGFDQNQIWPDRMGLDIMRERAKCVGGKLTIESQPDHGTEVILVWETP